MPSVSSGDVAKSSKSSMETQTAPRCVVISGASSGLGAALARAYAAPGRILGLCGRNETRLAAVAEACRQQGAQVHAARLDVGDAASVAAWLNQLDAAHGIDLLIANAGVSAGTRANGSPEGLETACGVVRTNLLGVMNCVETVLPGMLARQRGHIAVVASIAAYRGLPDSPSYCASKAGVLAYGEALRGALAAGGVHVSVIVPGFFASPMSVRYQGRKLFPLTEAQAVARVIGGLNRHAARIVFPLRLAVLMRAADLLPPRLGDRIIRAFAFRIEDRPDEAAT